MQPGQTVADRFEIHAQAGVGGMGVVYRARDQRTGAPVALKVLRGCNAEAVARFAREAEALLEVASPGVVRHVAHGVDADGAAYIAMEWLDGEDLAARLARGALSMPDTFALARRVAGTLAEVHARGVVHRDIKPSNLFLVGGDAAAVKVLDFGIARLEQAARATRTGAVLGSPGYMAPEQASGARGVGARADVFSLGCVLFACLTGREAFLGESALAVLCNLLLHDVPDVRAIRPDAPAPLADLVARMVAKDPAARPADGGEVAAALDALARPTTEARRPASATLGTERPFSAARLGAPPVAGASTTADSAGGRAYPALLGRTTTFVGRDRELAALEALFDHCASEPVASAALVLGGAGLGKSRVRYELVARLLARGAAGATGAASRPGGVTTGGGVGGPLASAATMAGGVAAQIWLARGDEAAQGSPLGMVAQILRREARILEGEPLAAHRDKLRARVARGVLTPRADEIAAFLGEIVGVPFPAEACPALAAARRDPLLMGDQMLRAWVELVDAECAARPLLVLLDDLQWADTPSVAYFDAALRALPERPCMMLALARPEVRGRFPLLWEGVACDEIALRPLPRKACEAIVREALGARIRDEDAARIAERAGGNPWFLEEIVRAVADGHDERTPATVLAVTQARLAELPPGPRRALTAGSLFGRAFRRGGVVALLGGAPYEAAADAWLADLVRREWILRRPAGGTFGEDAYAFRHALTRDAVYATLSDEDRRLGHRLAGAWLERAGDSDAAAIAQHLERGGEPARAAEAYKRAAARALERHDFASTLGWAARALACAAAGGEDRGPAPEGGAPRVDRAELLLLCADAHQWRGEHAEAEAAALEVMRAEPPGGRRWCIAVTKTAVAASRIGHYDLLLELAAALTDRLPLEDEHDSFVIAMVRVAAQLCFAGAFERADLIYARLDAVSERVREDPLLRAWITLARAVRTSFTGDAGAYRALIEDAVASFQEAGAIRAACQYAVDAGYACNELGDYVEGAARLEAALGEAERIGLPTAAAAARHNLGLSLLRLGRLDEARAVEASAAAAFQQQGNVRMEGACRLYLSAIHQGAGDLALAEAEARRAQELLATTAPAEPHALATLASVALTRGEPAAALSLAGRAAAAMASLGGIEEGEAWVRLVHAEALAAAGERAAARAVIEVARDRLLTRAERIAQLAWRESFLHNIPEHARTLALAEAWGAPPRAGC